MVRRPWGWFKVLAKGRGWWVKRLTVSGGRTSWQSHNQRDELWLIWIPRGTRHRIGGHGTWLELAFGNPRETDITRHADDYKRASHGKV